MKVFISYSQQDNTYKDAFLKQLSVLRHQSLIEVWHDKEIQPGEQWEPAIWDHFREADLILLLISADFLASFFCFELELKAALHRARSGSAKLIPIIVRSCNWEITEIGKLQCIPEKPVASSPNQDEAWTAVVKKIILVVQNLASTRAPRIEDGQDDHDGDAVIHFCDRQVQEEELWFRYLAKPPGVPQIYFLPGSEDAQHRSFLERVVYQTLPNMMGQPAASLRDSVRLVPAPWLEKLPTGREFPYLRTLIARAIDPALEPDAAKIKAHPRFSDKILLIHHRLFARYWNDKMEDLLTEYAQFWRAAAGGKHWPVILIFFLVTNSYDCPNPGERLTKLCQSLDHERCAVSLLPELRCVERDHVAAWMDMHTRRTSVSRDALLDELFTTSKCLPMRQVEKSLLQLGG